MIWPLSARLGGPFCRLGYPLSPRFGQFSGLKVNLNKTAAIVRNCGGMEWARCFRDIGVDVKNFVKYLGVRLGNIRHHQDDQGWGLTMEQAFALALQEAFRRARVVSTLQLSMNERAFMLTSWILPVVAWVSKAYYAPVSVMRQLKLVYHVTMGTNSWGITLPILSRPRTQGGLALPEPELFLMHQAAAPFVSLLGDPHKFPDKAVETFYAWATAIGFTPSKDNLPYIQLGMVRTADLTFLGWSAKAHSNIQRVAPQVAPPANRDRLPLWHSVYFRNEFRCSYYNTKLIRQGVLTWGQFQSLEDARLFNALPRTWKGVYNHGGRLLNKVMSQGGFDTPAVHTPKLDQGMAAPVLRLSARGPRPANTGGMGTAGTGTATTEGSRLCAKGAVAQTDRTCKSLQEVRH